MAIDFDVALGISTDVTEVFGAYTSRGISIPGCILQDNGKSASRKQQRKETSQHRSEERPKEGVDDVEVIPP
jgi:hypothetical protein